MIILIILNLFFNDVSTERCQISSELLTSYAWIEQGADGKYVVKHLFNKNGQYSATAGGDCFYGQWLWSGENEVYVAVEGIKSEKYSQEFNHGIGSSFQADYIRILEISDKEMRTLERIEGDAWDSGFAREGTYAAQELAE